MLFPLTKSGLIRPEEIRPKILYGSKKETITVIPVKIPKIPIPRKEYLIQRNGFM